MKDGRLNVDGGTGKIFVCQPSSHFMTPQ
jgi:hypothetical protein